MKTDFTRAAACLLFAAGLPVVFASAAQAGATRQSGPARVHSSYQDYVVPRGTVQQGDEPTLSQRLGTN